jgi:RNA polymerase sigma-70 factor (ECF subfamily)
MSTDVPDSVPAPAEVAAQRDYLLRVARRSLRDPALAEDAVHDVFTTVVAGQASFHGRSSLRTWLVGILKHKMVDILRRRSGECSLDAWSDEDDGAVPQTSRAPDPSQLIEQRQQLSQALERVAALPPSLRLAFEQRVLLERSTPEVCCALDITPSNLWVRLHRARKALDLASLEPSHGFQTGNGVASVTGA